MDETLDKRASSRRGFLKGVATASGAAPFMQGLALTTALAVAPDAAAQSDATIGYSSLSPDEASFVEALVNLMCPADGLTPNGVDCGLAIFIDRQLAGAFGRGDRLYRQGPWRTGKPQLGYQLPLTPEQFFKAGIEGTQAASVARFGRRFDELGETEAEAFLQDIATAKITAPGVPLSSWFNELVYPLFVQACFADPIYGGNRDKVFWKLVGYPALPAFHTQNMVLYRGKAFPAAAQPKSIPDFS